MGNEENSEIELVQEECLQCSIGDCCSKSDPSNFGVLSFHKVPKQPFGLRQSWINIIRQSRSDPEWIPDENSAVCSNHFRSNDLVKISGSKRVILDFESGRNIAPSLRLNIKVKPSPSVEITGDEEVNVVAADPAFNFYPIKIKQEPRSDEENDNGNAAVDSYSEDQLESTPSSHVKKVKRTPKPTWSLKELSDDEGARDRGSESSDYEPTSSSDSDSDKEKSSSSSSKRLRLSQSFQGVLGHGGSPPVINHSNWNQLLSGNKKRPSFANFKLKANHCASPISSSSRSSNLAQGSEEAAGLPYPERFVPHILKLIGWVEELVQVNRTSPTEAHYYSTCMSRLERILQCVNVLPQSELKSQIRKHFQGLVGVVQQRHTQGKSMANKVHFSLVSKKVLEILKAVIEKGINLKSSPNVTPPTGYSPQVTPPSGFGLKKVSSLTQGFRSIVPRRILPDLNPLSSAVASLPLAGSVPVKPATVPVTTVSAITSVPPIAATSVLPTPSRTQADPNNFVLNSASRMVNVRPVKPLVTAVSTSVEPDNIEPEIVTLDDDDDDDFTPTIESVTTLATPTFTSSGSQMRRVRGAPRSFARFFQTVLAMEVPLPAPDDQAESIPWMGAPSEDLIDETARQTSVPIFAAAPVFPRGKFPPNVPVALDQASAQMKRRNTAPTLVSSNGPIALTSAQALANRSMNFSQKLRAFAGQNVNGVRTGHGAPPIRHGTPPHRPGLKPGLVPVSSSVKPPVPRLAPAAAPPTKTSPIITPKHPPFRLSRPQAPPTQQGVGSLLRNSISTDDVIVLSDSDDDSSSKKTVSAVVRSEPVGCASREDDLAILGI